MGGRRRSPGGQQCVLVGGCRGTRRASGRGQCTGRLWWLGLWRPPVYVQPAPVYAAPAPVYYRPRVVAPVVYRPVVRPYGYGYRHHRHGPRPVPYYAPGAYGVGPAATVGYGP